jgi:DNA-binding HxlR family transcriptional regulator
MKTRAAADPLNLQRRDAPEVGGPGAAPGEADGLLWTATTQRVLSLLSRKWVVASVRTLHDEAKRPGQLRREIKGIQPKVLRETLRALEAEGLVDQILVRDSLGDRYICWNLTPHGRTLAVPLAALYQWGRQHLTVDVIDLTEIELPAAG